MLTFFKLFGKSPFTPLLAHLEKVSECVQLLFPLFEKVKDNDYTAVQSLAQEISKLEHKADLAKNDIRNHLSKSIFLPIDRSSLLEILTLQDSIADTAEDAAVLLCLKEIKILPEFEKELFSFLQKNIETFEEAKHIVKELSELLESSFGGSEAIKVRDMVDHVAFMEHQSDLVQRKLLQRFFECEDKMSFGTFYLWQNVARAISDISNYSENLSLHIRRTLELNNR
jgi:predicted phosphate transport protein (TIGR00153 family)